MTHHQLYLKITAHSFLTEYRRGNGKILLYNTSPVLSWSNFPIKSIFPTLMNRSVYYLASKTTIENNLIAGNHINVFLGKGIKNRLTLKEPDESEEIITIDETNNGYIELKSTNAAGIYKFYSDKEVVQQVAVNTDPRESVSEQLNTNAGGSFSGEDEL